ncbi:hypothetical protein [Williamsia sp. D3]|uniref:hypothetical protein n=1 Tax=Williamsia sp. D3 TaxID=1313067 RepID=UPI00350EFE78
MENGCLLCRTCHRAVHHTDWDIIIGSDGHPWLIPPADIDPMQNRYRPTTVEHSLAQPDPGRYPQRTRAVLRTAHAQLTSS